MHRAPYNVGGVCMRIVADTTEPGCLIGHRGAAVIGGGDQDLAVDPRHEVVVVHRAVVVLTEEARQLVVAALLAGGHVVDPDGARVGDVLLAAASSEPPPASSPKATRRPSQVNADECHALTSGVVNVWIGCGAGGSLISQSWRTLSQAAAASFRGWSPVMLWQPSVSSRKRGGMTGGKSSTRSDSNTGT